MRFSVAAAVLSAAVSTQAATWNVVVGANETLTYTPSSLTGVAAGDVVSFQFVSKNHTVTQSTFADPCTAAGVSSGFQDVPNPNATTFPTWSITVENVTSPLWFFCQQTTNTTTHCQDGMVFAINPTAAKNFTTFQATAMGTVSSSPAGQNPPGTVVTSAGVDGPVSASSVGTQTAETPSASDASSSGTTSSNTTGSTTGTSGASSPTTTNAAMKMSGSSISLLAVAGLVAGLAL